MDAKLWKHMTPEEKGALLLAAHEGKPLQYRKWGAASWEDCNSVGGIYDYEYYRVKPEPEPREFWLWLNGRGEVLHKFLKPISPADVQFLSGGDIIHVREVLK